MIIEGLTFKLTCEMFPEQYNVYNKDNKQVGYVRIRNNWLICESPHAYDEVVYETEIEGYGGGFEGNKQRTHYLTKIAQMLNEKISNNR